MNDNIKNNNNKCNDAIEYDPKFDNIFILSSGTKYPLAVATEIFRGGRKQGATTIAGLTCLWDSGSINSIIKRQHTKHDKRKTRSNKIESSMRTM